MEKENKTKYKVYQNDEYEWTYEKVDEDTSLLSIFIFMLIMLLFIGLFCYTLI